MLKSYGILSIFLLLGFLGSCSKVETGPQVRMKKQIDFDWQFKLGEFPDAKEPTYNDSSWRTLDIPHDWSIEGKYAPSHSSGWRGGYLPGGIGWYRKSIPWKSAWEDKIIRLTFDGVYMNSDVWINGHHLGHRPYGYTTFSYDITPYLTGGENVIAVRVDNLKLPSGRWYTGSGIYRHVWLTTMNTVHIPEWGTFVTTPDITQDQATIRIKTAVQNSSAHRQALVLESRIENPDGREISSEQQKIILAAEDCTVVEQDIIVDAPRLWSPDSPVMYTLRSIVKEGNTVHDNYRTPFGIRKLEFSVTDGFKLNGESVILKGVSNHHTTGGVGAAVPDDILYRNLKLLKEMGCNAVRTAHNPQSPDFYNICDTLGLMVMNEAFDGWDAPKVKYDYGLYFEKWWRRDLRDFIRRDRNHPSVIMWSIGNEVRGMDEKDYLARQKQIIAEVRSLDPTRPITEGGADENQVVDIAGFNGHGEEKGVLESFHQAQPNRVAVGTEITHTLQTRSVYRTQTWYRRRDFPAPYEVDRPWEPYADRVFHIPDLTKEEIFTEYPAHYLSSYDNAIIRIGVRDQWNRTQKFPWFIGTFRWTGLDYLGEVFTQWPGRASDFGIIDLAGIPKDHYYLYQSLWAEKPMVHIVPHWTHPTKDGMKIPVVVYTNAEAAELIQDGHSLGTKPMTTNHQIVWRVSYRPGELVALAKQDGEVVAENSVRTAGEPYGIKLKTNREVVQANQRDIIRIEANIVDKHGTLHPRAENRVHFDIEGPAEFIGVDNGDIMDLEPVTEKSRLTFMGKCVGLFRTTETPGEIIITASSKRLNRDVVTITSVK